jgi:SAM domain (Sterile alpha motif)
MSIMTEVEHWLSSLLLKNNYSSNFNNVGIESLENVKSLTSEDLRVDVGIKNIPDRKVIETGIGS